MRGRLPRLAASVRALYRSLDRSVASFRRASGLACPQGCGHCCLSPEVEATVLEMLPLAIHLLQQERLEATLGLLESGEGEPPWRGPTRRCVFYSPHPLGARGGHCGVYAWRPALCRLFGFAAVVDRAGRPRLAACGKMREADPGPVGAAAAAVAAGRLAAPWMGEGSAAARRLDPNLGSSLLPINEALRQALERLALEQGLRAGPSGGGKPGPRRGQPTGGGASPAAA